VADNLRSRLIFLEAIIYSGVCFGLWLIPVFDRLHVESSAAISFVAFFIAGLQSIRRRDRPLRQRLVHSVSWLMLPLILMSVSSLWAPNCDYVRGLLFFLLFAPVTVFFSVSLSELLVHSTRHPSRWLILLGLGISLITPLFDVGLHPQFYTYNHVFGGILGPIYDSELVVRPGLFGFRLLTLLWGFLFLALTRRLRSTVVTITIAIGVFYLFPGEVGINTPASFLQDSFSGKVETDHFEIYFDAEATSDAALDRLVDEHEFRYTELEETLGWEPTSRVISYVYPDENARARFTGARRTSVAPVWLRKPQVHVVKSSFYDVFPHELVHVFSREIGLPVVNASIHVGLVEGLAVALEPPDGRPSPHELVSAFESAAKGEEDWTVGEQLTRSFSPLGFWSGRGAVSYTMNGSFVRLLLETRGAENFAEAYATGAFEQAYGQTAAELASEWQTMLQSMSISHPEADSQAHRQFSIPSLFEVSCPHYVSPVVRDFRKAVTLISEGKLDEAIPLLTMHQSESASARLLMAELSLGSGVETATAYLASRPDSVRVLREWLLAANIAVIEGDSAQAIFALDEVESQLAVSDYVSQDAVDARRKLANKPGVAEQLNSATTLAERIYILSSVGENADLEDSEQRAVQFLLGRALLAEDRPEEALLSFRYVVRLHEDLYPSATLLALRAAYFARDLASAQAYADRSRVQFQHDPAMLALIDNWINRISWKTK